MLGMARLLGQTFGTTLVALLFSFVVHNRSTAVCLMVGSGFAVVAAIGQQSAGCRNRLR